MQVYLDIKKEEKSSLAERLAYIDFKLQFTGFVKRSEIGDLFNVADAAASKALSEYSKRFKGNIEYDASLKVNVISKKTFKSMLKFDAEVALGMLANGFNKNKLLSPASNLIAYEKIDSVPNKLSVDCVAKITRAISGGYCIECKYISESSSNHDTRVIAPLAIMYDGTTWMFRGFYRDDPKEVFFKNFHFSRVRNVVELDESKEGYVRSNESLSEDNAWKLKIPLELSLHPQLDDKMKKQVRLDFGMSDDANDIMIPVRCSSLWILTRKWFIDDRSEEEKTNDNKSSRFKFYKFVLINRETVEYLKSSI